MFRFKVVKFRLEAKNEIQIVGIPRISKGKG